MKNINSGFNWTSGTPNAVNNRLLNTQNKYPLAFVFNKINNEK